MTAKVRMSEHGLTFATRPRADRIVGGIPQAGHVTLDFDGVLVATPSFLDGLIGALSERDAEVAMTGLAPQLERYAARIVERRGLGSRFRFAPAA